MSRIHEALKKVERERALSERQNPADQRAIPPAPPDEPVSTPLWDRLTKEEWSPQPSMLFFGSQTSEGTEEFRDLRSKLYQFREQRPLRTILITSALPNEGKSFVTANLAQAIACQPGRKALLIDADLRNGRLHEFLGMPNGPGLADYLLNESEETAVIKRGPLDNLAVITMGRHVVNPAELLANGRLKNLLNQMEATFHWIVIDSPPVIPVTDPRILADYCDGVLIVVRADSTPSDAARKAQNAFSEKRLIGSVLNGMATASIPYYGAYNHNS